MEKREAKIVEEAEEAVLPAQAGLSPNDRIYLRDLLRPGVALDLVRNPVKLGRLSTRDLVLSVSGYNLAKNGAIGYAAASVAENAGSGHSVAIGVSAGVISLLSSASFLTMIGYLGVRPALKKLLSKT